jgi:hypothetical protein
MRNARLRRQLAGTRGVKLGSEARGLARGILRARALGKVSTVLASPYTCSSLT